MTEKKPGVGAPADAKQVFRQFAWHLAGTLAQRKTAASAPRPRAGRVKAAR